MKPLPLHDDAPDVAVMREEIRAGLAQPQKTLPCKYFYDERGSRLFDRICELEEYYPTRTEQGILERHAGEMARRLGPDCLLIEYGSGSSLKTRLLLDAAPELAAYVPIDISCEHLHRAAADLAASYPHLEVLPVCADYNAPYTIPAPRRRPRRWAGFFPGSTLGNFTPEQAEAFLRHVAETNGSGGGLLIGIDLVKDPAVLERAYNDAAGVTAAFNLNLLHRLNRELGADFDPGAFQHRAIWNPDRERVEMHLVSARDQTVHLDGEAFVFRAGETIHTENSHKFRLEGFAAMAGAAGFAVQEVWTDDRDWFAVLYLEVG